MKKKEKKEEEISEKKIKEKKMKEKCKKKKSLLPIVDPLLFGPLLAQFLACGKCSNALTHLSHLLALFSWPIVGSISCLKQCLRLKLI